MKKNKKLLLVLLSLIIVSLIAIYINFTLNNQNIIDNKSKNNKKTEEIKKQSNDKEFENIVLKDEDNIFVYNNDNRKIETKNKKISIQLPTSKIYEDIKVKDSFVFNTKNNKKLYVFIVDLGEGENEFNIIDNNGIDVLDAEKVSRKVLKQIINFTDNNKVIIKEKLIDFLKKLDEDNIFDDNI